MSIELRFVSEREGKITNDVSVDSETLIARDNLKAGEISGHTPGPWKWMRNDTESGLDGDSPLMSQSGERVLQLGDCYPSGGEPNAANANLIAAAPELLEALENLLWHAEQLEEFQESERGKGQTIDQMYAAGEMHAYMVAAKALISRAKGQA